MKKFSKLTIFHFVSQAIRNHIFNALSFCTEIFTFNSSSSLFHLWLIQEIPFNRNFITLLHKRIFRYLIWISKTIFFFNLNSLSNFFFICFTLIFNFYLIRKHNNYTQKKLWRSKSFTTVEKKCVFLLCIFQFEILILLFIFMKLKTRLRSLFIE